MSKKSRLTIAALALCLGMSMDLVAQTTGLVVAWGRNNTGQCDARHVFWTDVTADVIQCSNPDGTGRITLRSHEPFPSSIAVDAIGGKMYWTDFHLGAIQRADLDGSAAEWLLGTPDSRGIALDVSAGKMYWTDRTEQSIQRANLDGSGREALVSSLGGPEGIVIDAAGGKIYWTDFITLKIQRANLDGSDVEDLVTELYSPQGVALDPAAGHMYFTDSMGGRRIARANLDGSGFVVILAGVTRPNELAIDVEGGMLYWSEVSGRGICRAPLDGAWWESIYHAPGVSGIALSIVPPCATDLNCDNLLNTPRPPHLPQRLGGRRPPRRLGR
jgi:sugar lactone lactonase YvrE